MENSKQQLCSANVPLSWPRTPQGFLLLGLLHIGLELNQSFFDFTVRIAIIDLRETPVPSKTKLTEENPHVYANNISAF